MHLVGFFFMNYFVDGRNEKIALASTVLLCSLTVPSLSLSLSLCWMEQNTVHTEHKFYTLLLLL